MIDCIFNAYVGTRQQKDGSFLKTLKRAEIEDKVFMIIFCVCFLATFITLAMDQIIISASIFITLIVAYETWMTLDRKRAQKKWDVNIQNYQERLDMIKGILSDPVFNMYEKNKLKQLIRKYKMNTNICDNDNLEMKGNCYNFLDKYIIPVIAFSAGKLFQEMTSEDIFEVCLYILIIIFSVKILAYGILSIHKEIVEGNKIKRKRQFMQELQDLLDRDFSIEENDLL